MRLGRFHILAAVSIALCCVPGCVFTKPRTICRVWADWNTYGCWSVSAERLEHLPYRRPQVEYLLWEYGAGPNGPQPGDASGGACHGNETMAAVPTPVNVVSPPGNQLPGTPTPGAPTPALIPNEPDVPRPPQDLAPPPEPGRPRHVPPPPQPVPAPTASTMSGVRPVSGSEKIPLPPGQDLRQPRGAWLFAPAQRAPSR